MTLLPILRLPSFTLLVGWMQCGTWSTVREHIRTQPSARSAAREGRRRDFPLRPDWEENKEAAMMYGLRKKFAAHDDIRQSLLMTGNATLVEHTKNDSYWGDGGDGTGKNRLGILLMQLREELREEANG